MNKTEAAYKINMILCDYIELGHSRGDVYAAVRKIIDSIEPEAKEAPPTATQGSGTAYPAKPKHPLAELDDYTGCQWSFADAQWFREHDRLLLKALAGMCREADRLCGTTIWKSGMTALADVIEGAVK